MGSSSGGTDYNTPPTGPDPTNAPIVPQGGSPVQNPWVNFLDPGMGMSTGITPRMEAAMKAQYAPAAGGGVPAFGQAGRQGLTGDGMGRDQIAQMIALNSLRDRKMEEYAGKHFDHPGALTAQQYVDTNWPLPKGPTQAAPTRGRV